jgi:hypothetical protein
MAWRALTEADLLTGITGAELAVARAVVLKAGQPDPVAPSIQSVTDRIRGSIIGSVNIVLGPEGTIPDKLIEAAIDMVVWRLVKRIPGETLATKTRKEANSDAQELLKLVAANKFRIEAPIEVSSEQTAVPTPAISNRPGEERRRQQEGL